MACGSRHGCKASLWAHHPMDDGCGGLLCQPHLGPMPCNIALRHTINEIALRRGADGYRSQRSISAQYQNRLGIWRENNLGDSGQDLLHRLQV